MVTFLVIAAIFLLSWVGTEIFRRFSLRRSLLDIPNERSSHTAPVPRGGGILVVVLSLAVYAFMAIFGHAPLSLGYFIGAALVAAISLADDLISIPFLIRLFVHILAGTLVIYDSGSFTSLHLPMSAAELSFGLIGPAITLVWLVWMINSYNFMDGIDGIAGIQAIVAAGGWMTIAYFLELQGLMIFCAAIAASVAGFLVHNWSPARIFMGDVGSAFLGFTFGSLPLLVARGSRLASGWLFATAIIILWPFIFDTAYTLLRRIARRERLWEAHKGHLYQRLVATGYSHRTVSVFYGASALVLTTLAVVTLLYAGYLELLLVLLTATLTATLLTAVHLRKGLT